MGIRVAAAGAVALLSAGWLGMAAGPAAFAEKSAAPADVSNANVPAAGPAHPVVPSHSSVTAAPSGSASLFDPERHMHVSEVRAGMKGYGLSVFKGTKIERFEVEVQSVLKNFNPKYDVVLITCRGQNLEHTGAIAGMSGSPVYLKDDRGRERMIGAFAYGWPLTKDPIAGVQPIEYMLTLPLDRPADKRGDKPGKNIAGAAGGAGPAGESSEPAGGAAPRATWSLADAAAQWDRLTHPAARPGARGAGPQDDRGAGRLAGEDAPRLQPLATPLMAAGLSSRVLDQFAPLFKAQGLVPLQAGGGGSGAAEEPPAVLEPGSVLAVPLITGDAEMTAVGTCTEVLGDRVFGFGHAFNNEGPVSLPMGSGRINGIVPTLSTSFKLGSITQNRGQLTSDQTVGIAGRVGPVPPMVPIEVKVVYPHQEAKTYRFKGASHPKFTPLICGAAFAAALSGTSDLPQYNTVDYAVDLEFENGKTVHIADTAANAQGPDLFQGIGLSLTAAAENPFERVMVRKVTATVKIAAEVREGQILDVNVPRLKYRPGETVKAFVTYKPFRSEEAIMPVELELPKDLPQGQYGLVISDADRFATDEMATKPFRFTAERASEVFDVLRDAAAIRHNAVYVRLVRQPDGVAIGRTAMPQLPGSRRQILMGAGRSNTTPFVSSTTKVIPTDRVMAGSAEFQLQIETHGKVEAGSHGPATRPAGAAPKAEEPKGPRSGAMEAKDKPAPKEGEKPKEYEKKDGEGRDRDS